MTVKLKNYIVVMKLFGLMLTFLFITSCAEKKYAVVKIEGKEIKISETFKESSEIENIIQPYRNKIDADLSKVISFAPQTIDKNGEWQTPMGNFLADITLEESNIVFKSREKKTIDLCLLNHGGIRSIIPKGDITTRIAYEVMPFENSAMVLELKAEQLIEMARYIINEKKPHPLSGMEFTINQNNEPIKILIQGKPLDSNKNYFVVTSDYLANGGDNMIFFKKAITKFDLDYKLRNIIIDYFTSHKIIEAATNKRIIKE
jgi:2',3'-cyclic-nucleotide 2'-phosphodiesterase (5'-nucleotidase family)